MPVAIQSFKLSDVLLLIYSLGLPHPKDKSQQTKGADLLGKVPCLLHTRTWSMGSRLLASHTFQKIQLSAYLVYWVTHVVQHMRGGHRSAAGRRIGSLWLDWDLSERWVDVLLARPYKLFRIGLLYLSTIPLLDAAFGSALMQL